jgi:hypothetical protein
MVEEPETREARYNRQTTENFAAIGRFVQAFELMVHATRTGSLLLVAKDHSQQALLNRILHHSALSAMPLFEIWRSLVTAIVTELLPNLAPEQRDTTLLVLSQLAKDFQEIVAERNKLLHATWLIGWAGSGEQDFSRAPAMKFSWDKKGALSSHVAETPGELIQLAAKCGDTEHAIRSLVACFVLSSGPRVVENFQKIDGRWVTTIGRG